MAVPGAAWMALCGSSGALLGLRCWCLEQGVATASAMPAGSRPAIKPAAEHVADVLIHSLHPCTFAVRRKTSLRSDPS